MKAYEIKPAPELVPLSEDGIDPGPNRVPFPTLINVRGREEHEAILRYTDKMKLLGLDPYYEIMVYLGRWGGWLKDD